MPDEKAEAVATYTARGREDAPAAPRHASLIVFVEINCFRPSDPQHCASQGVQLPVALAVYTPLCGTAISAKALSWTVSRSVILVNRANRPAGACDSVPHQVAGT
jgi:hypothetical protein